MQDGTLLFLRDGNKQRKFGVEMQKRSVLDAFFQKLKDEHPEGTPLVFGDAGFSEARRGEPGGSPSLIAMIVAVDTAFSGTDDIFFLQLRYIYLASPQVCTEMI